MPTEPTPELVLTSDVADDPQLSPDGRRVVWTAQPLGYEGEGFRASLWIAEVGAPASTRRLTADGDHRDHHPRWSPDGTHIAFLTDRVERGDDALAVLPVDGGEARVVVTREARSVSGPAWSPDGTRIAFIAADERTEEEVRREEEHDDAEVYGEHWTYGRINLLDIAADEVTTLPTGEHHVLQSAWSPDGDALAFLAAPTPELERKGDAELFLLHLDAAEPRSLTTTPNVGGDLVWLRPEEGTDRLVWSAGHDPGPQCGWAIWSTTTDGGAPTLETTDLDVCEIGLRPTADGRDAVVIVADGLGYRLRWLDGEVVLDEPEADIRTLSVGNREDDGRLAMVRSTATEPWEVWTRVAGELERVSDHQAGWREVALAPQEAFRWTAHDGLELDGLVIRPPGVSGVLPTILLPHGGPYARWAHGFAGTLGNWGQWLAAAGFQVLLPNPRGGMGHGDAFARCVRGEVGQDDYRDMIGMADAAIGRGLADPDRLGIGGWSQGGYMAAWAVTQTDRFKAAVVGAGVTDWGMLTMDTDVPRFEAELGGSRPWDGVGPHRAARNSPISFAADVTTPVLLLHGKDDARIPPNQAIGFARALREHNVEVEQVLYPRAPHGPRERNHQLDLYRRVRAWFERFV